MLNPYHGPMKKRSIQWDSNPMTQKNQTSGGQYIVFNNRLVSTLFIKLLSVFITCDFKPPHFLFISDGFDENYDHKKKNQLIIDFCSFLKSFDLCMVTVIYYQ